MPWERRHRRLTERVSFFLAVCGALIILAAVLSILYSLPPDVSSSIPSIPRR